MTGCCNSFLCYSSNTTNSTLLTFGKTGFSACGSLACYGFFGVTGCCNSFLCYSSNTTNSTLLTFGKTGCGASRCYCRNGFFGVTGCCNSFLCYSSNTTTSTLLTFGKTGFGTCGSLACYGFFGVTGCCNSFLCYSSNTTNSTLLTFGKTDCSTSRSYCRNGFFGVTLCRNCFLISFTTVTCILFVTINGTSGIFRINQLIKVACVRPPNTIGICIGIICSCYIRTISVLQLCRGKRNICIVVRITQGATYISRLNGGGFGTYSKGNNRAFFTVDVSSTLCSISKTLGAIHYSACFYKNFSIYKVIFGTSIFLTGSIGNRDKLLVASTGIITPFVCIIQIYSGTTGKLHVRTRFNNHLCAGKHSNVLVINLNVTLINMNCDIAIDRQLIFFTINCCGTKTGTNRHLDRRYLHRTVNVDVESIGCTIVTLYNVTIRKVKHSTAICKERNRCCVCTQRHSNRCIAVQGRTGINCHRHFYVLNIVLVHGEYGLFNISCTVTAAEIGNLEGLVNVSTRVNSYSTLTGDITVNVHAAVNSDVTTLFHYDVTITAYRASCGSCTLCSFDNGGNTKCTINYNLCTACHGKRSVSKGIGLLGRSIRACCFYGFSRIIGNQQRYTRGNGVCSRGKCTVSRKNNGFSSTTCCCVDCIGEIIVKGTTDSEACRTVCEYSLDIHIALWHMVIGCLLRQNFVVCGINPRNKLAAVLCGSYKLSTFDVIHGKSTTVSSCHTVNRYRTEGIVVGQSTAKLIGLNLLELNGHVGKCKLCFCRSPLDRKSLLSFQVNGKCIACSNFLTVGSSVSICKASCILYSNRKM